MINFIYQTLYALVKLCFLRKDSSPADLPHSYSLLLFLLGTEIVLNVASLSQLKGTYWPEVVAAFLVSTLLLSVLLYSLLAKKQYQNRFIQTLTAWFGTTLVLSLFSHLLILPWPNENVVAQSVIILIFLMWGINVKAHILKLSLVLKTTHAFLIAIAIILVSALPVQFILSSTLQAK